MSRTASSLSFVIIFTLVSFASIGSWSSVGRVMASDDCPLISRSLAARHGLQRQWHTQVVLDPSNNRVTHLTLASKSETSPDTLFVQTERSTVFAIDAETGKTLWSRLVGRPELISGSVGCSDQMVAVLNGSTLFILNRLNGRILWTRSFPGVPASGPVLSNRYAYVPFLDGCVAAYPIRKIADPAQKKSRNKNKTDGLESQEGSAQATSLEKPSAGRLILSQEKMEPLLCASLYRIETQPVLVQNDATADRLAWINKRGMYVGTLNNQGRDGFEVDYALTSSLSFESSPAFVSSRFTHPDEKKREKEPDGMNPFDESGQVKEVPIFGALLVASTDGQINAIQAGSGATLWEYHVGQPIVKPIVAIGDRAFAVSQFGLMLCFDSPSGKKLWEIRGVSQFVAQTKERVYVLDSDGRSMSILDRTDGRRIDKLPISGFTNLVSNDQTDRLFFATKTGFVQSLRQQGVKEPIRHLKFEE